MSNPPSSKVFTMKPDIKNFPVLKSEDGFPLWLERLEAVCSSVQLGEVCDMVYVPQSMSEQESFTNKCKWLYWAFQQIIKTPAGINIVRNHAHSKDARMILYELSQLYKVSATADMRAGAIISELVGMRLNGVPRQGYEAFIIEFNQKMMDYNDVVRFDSQRLSEETMRAYLQRAITDVKELTAITDRENDRISEWGYGARFTYAGWLFQIKEKARTLDMERAMARDQASRRRSANLHQLIEELAVDDTDDGNTDDLEVNMHRHIPGSRMDRATWKGLSPEAQSTWDTLSDEDKAAILASTSKRSAKPPGALKKTVAKRAVHFQDSIESPTDDGEETEKESTDLEVHDTSLKEVNETKAKAHPADSRRMLGQQKAPSKDKGTPTAKAFHAALADDESCELYDASASLGLSDDDSSVWGANSAANIPDVEQATDDYWGDQEDQFF